MTPLRRFLLHRRLKRVVRDLPRRVVEELGAYDRCTFGQARRAISGLGLPRSALPYAYAAVCGLRELQGRFPLSAEEYRRLRAELADLFYLPSHAFTIRDLAAPVHSHGPIGGEGTPIGDGR